MKASKLSQTLAGFVGGIVFLIACNPDELNSADAATVDNTQMVCVGFNQSFLNEMLDTTPFSNFTCTLKGSNVQFQQNPATPIESGWHLTAVYFVPNTTRAIYTYERKTEP